MYIKYNLLSCFKTLAFGQVQDLKDGSVMAVKKMFAQSREQLQDAQWEAEVSITSQPLILLLQVHRALDNSHVLKLVDYAINSVPSSPTTKEVVMLLPYYEVCLYMKRK